MPTPCKGRPCTRTPTRSTAMRDNRPLPPLPILPGTRALHPREETGERGGLREVQAFSYLTDGERGLQQEVGSLHRAMSLRFNPRPHRGGRLVARFLWQDGTGVVSIHAPSNCALKPSASILLKIVLRVQRHECYELLRIALFALCRCHLLV